MDNHASQPKRKDIRVEGHIHVGKAMKLSYKRAGSVPPKAAYTPRAAGQHPRDHIHPDTVPGELLMERLIYNLEETEENVYLSNKGLSASYGIFGAPGSGKTHLLLYLLRQLLAFKKDQDNLKYGALILDPKAALMDDIYDAVKAAGRLDDLIIINTDRLLESNSAINVIHSELDYYELGQMLVLAAQSAGVSTSDPYWLLAWGNIFGAALYILALGNYVPTLRTLLNEILSVVPDENNKERRKIQETTEQKLQKLLMSSPDDALLRRLRSTKDGFIDDIKLAARQINRFFSQENDNIATIENVITSAYGPFQRSRYQCYSQNIPQAKLNGESNFYDQIIEEGKIVLVSLSPFEPAVSKTLCTLVKCLFQRTVLGRLERVQTQTLRNFERPLLLACDEYSQVASELPGQPMGDGDFFSQSRQNGCMGLLATQSVNVLQSSSLKDAWRSIFSNFGAKIFMRLVDNETIEEATKLAGEYEYYVTSQGTSTSKDGIGSSTSKDLKERKVLQSSVLTQVFRMGDAVILGSLDGSTDQSAIRFLHVPKEIS